MKLNTKKGNAIVELVLFFPFIILLLVSLYWLFSRGVRNQKQEIAAQYRTAVELRKK